MATTYIDLTNKLLRRINEVPISQSDFPSVRGVQAVAKDAIIASVEAINQKEREWPFNASVKNQLLTAGQLEYDFPIDLRVINWDSFHVKKNVPLNVSHSRLKFVSRDFWDAHQKDRDLDAVPNGLDVPNMVFQKHGFGFGISPNPNKAYTVTYEYFTLSPSLVVYGDVTTIPTAYDEAIIQGGLYHFYMFRSNVDQADRAEKRFKDEIEEMRTILVDKDDRVRSSVISRPRSYGAQTGFSY